MIREACTQPSEEGQLGGVDNADRPGIRTDAHVEADRGPEPRQLVDAHGGYDSSLDPPDMCSGHPGRSTDDVDRVTEDLASDAKLMTYPESIGGGDAAAAVDRAFPGAHRASVPSHAHQAITSGSKPFQVIASRRGMPHRSIALVFALLAVTVQALALAVSPVNAHETVTGTPAVTITVGTGLSDREVHVLVGAISGSGTQMTSGIDSGRGTARASIPATSRRESPRRSGSPRQARTPTSTSGMAATRGTTGGSWSAAARPRAVRRPERAGRRAEQGQRTAARRGGASSHVAERRRNRGEGAAPLKKKTATVTMGTVCFSRRSTGILCGGTVTFAKATATSTRRQGAFHRQRGARPRGGYEQTMPRRHRTTACAATYRMRGTIEGIGAAAHEPSRTRREARDRQRRRPAIRRSRSSTLPSTSGARGPRGHDCQLDPYRGRTAYGDGEGRVIGSAGTLESGATFEHTFATAGTFAYVCQIHPLMAGTIEVTGVAVVDPAQRAEPDAGAGQAGNGATDTAAEPAETGVTGAAGAAPAQSGATAAAGTPDAEPANADRE